MDKSETALSRRRAVCGLIGVGGIAVAAASPGAAPLRQAVAALTCGGALSVPTPPSLANGSYEQWLRVVGTSFAATGGYRLKLVGVRPIGSTANRAAAAAAAAASPRLRGRAFVASFDVTRGQAMAGSLIYRVARGQDRFDLYLDAGTRPRRMQAVFG